MLEIAIQGFVSFWDVGEEKSPVLAFLGYAVLGALVGAGSLFFFQTLFIRSPSGRLVNLVATPVLAGLGMSLIGWIRTRSGREIIRLDQFAYGWIFALGMALVRFLFGTR